MLLIRWRMMPTEKRTTRGRQKIEIKHIEKGPARQVCFTKRRAGLFNMANKLSVLSGAEIAIITFSASGRAYSFGHPSVDSVADRFLSVALACPPRCGIFGDPPATSSAAGASAVSELDRRCRELEERLEDARRMKGVLEAQLLKKSGAMARLLNGEVEMGFEDLARLGSAMEKLKLHMKARVEQLVVEQQAMSMMVSGDMRKGVGGSFAWHPAAAENMMPALPRQGSSFLAPPTAEVNMMMDALPPQGGGSFLEHPAAEENKMAAFPHLFDDAFFAAPPAAEDSMMAYFPHLDLDDAFFAGAAAEDSIMASFLAAVSAAEENTTMAALSPPWDFDYDFDLF